MVDRQWSGLAPAQDSHARRQSGWMPVGDQELVHQRRDEDRESMSSGRSLWMALIA